MSAQLLQKPLQVFFCSDKVWNIKQSGVVLASMVIPQHSSLDVPQDKTKKQVDLPDVLPEDPENRVLYLRHWKSIRTEEATGNRVQDSYNFTLHEMTASTFTEMVHRIFREQTTAFKINVS
jgi:hypothetical protein